MNMPTTYEKFGPGKFGDNVEQAIYDASLDTTPAIDGDSSYALVVFDEEERAALDVVGNDYEGTQAAIVLERGDGFVYVETYDDASKAESAFAKIEAEIAAECESGST